jgi:hypothetical protein
MDTKAFGPYRVEGYDKRGNLRLKLVGVDGAVAGEEIQVHPDDCKYWPGEVNKKNTQVPLAMDGSQYQITLSKPNKQQKQYLEYLGSDDDKSIPLGKIIGQRVQVYWDAFSNWEEGLVKSYDVKKKRFWVEYFIDRRNS